MKLLCLLVLTALSLRTFACTEGETAFAKTLHVELVNNCIDCHDSDGMGPGHAQSDIMKAYKIAKSLTDFNQPEASQFYKKVKAKHWLKYDDEAQGMSEDKVLTLINSWYQEGEKFCDDMFGYATATKEIKLTDLPEASTGKFTTLKWDMSAVHESLKDAVFSIEVQNYKAEGTDGNSLRWRKPRLATPKAVKVEAIQLVVNNQINQLENAFFGINQYVYGRNAQEIAEDKSIQLLSSETMVTLPRVGDVQKLGVTFKRISKAPAKFTCRDMASFNEFMVEATAAKCISCHGDVNSAANKKLDFNLPSEDLCRELALRSQSAVSSMTPVLELATKGKLEHPKIENLNLSAKFKKSYLKWFAGEFPRD